MGDKGEESFTALVPFSLAAGENKEEKEEEGEEVDMEVN